jgi:hypothetical protein
MGSSQRPMRRKRKWGQKRLPIGYVKYLDRMIADARKRRDAQVQEGAIAQRVKIRSEGEESGSGNCDQDERGEKRETWERS